MGFRVNRDNINANRMGWLLMSIDPGLAGVLYRAMLNLIKDQGIPEEDEFVKLAEAISRQFSGMLNISLENVKSENKALVETIESLGIPDDDEFVKLAEAISRQFSGMLNTSLENVKNKALADLIESERYQLARDIYVETLKRNGAVHDENLAPLAGWSMRAADALMKIRHHTEEDDA